MNNFYSVIKLLLEVIIEKNLPPTFSARTLFIIPSTVSVGLKTINSNIVLLDEKTAINKIDILDLLDLELSEKRLNKLIIYLSNKALELLNSDIKSDLITKYLQANTFNINFIKPKVLDLMCENMEIYYNYRNKDGWKESNKQIPMTNTNYINVNKPLNPNDFNDLAEWCPLDGQKMLGSQWGKVWGLLSEPDVLEINKFLQHEISQVNIITQCKIVLDKSLNLTNKEKIIAEFWAGIGGTVTPPGFFNMFLIGYFKSNCASNQKQLEYFYKLSSGLFQASIIAWGAKYTYFQCRPIQSIRLNYPGIPIDYYFGETTTDLWKPFQEARLWTPPFPDFISGHSTFSSTAGTILTNLLGPNLSNLNILLSKEDLQMLSPIFKNNNIDYMSLTDIIVLPDSSNIEPNVPDEYIILNFKTWDELSESAGISRIYGGIHYPSSNTIALETGKMIANILLGKK